MPAAEKLLRRRAVEELLGVGTSAIYSWMDRSHPSYNPDFPRPLVLSRDCRGRATVVAWRESDLSAFIETLHCEVAA